MVFGNNPITPKEAIATEVTARRTAVRIRMYLKAYGSFCISVFRQKFFNLGGHDLLAACFLPVQFSIPPVSKLPFLIDQIDAGPHRIAPCIPILLVVVDHDGKVELSFLGLGASAIGLAFALSFRRVNTNDDQTSIRIRLVPTPVPGVIAYAVDSSKGVEMQGHYLSAKIRKLKRFGIEPLVARGQFGCLERNVA
jgi:hypothetical protein